MQITNIDRCFTNEIFPATEFFAMQSQTGKQSSDIRIVDSQYLAPRSYVLYEEYSKNRIAEVIRERRVMYEMTAFEKRKELEEQVEAEVNDFCRWLVEAKGFESSSAHYRAVSLKSLLLGLPFGPQIAELFNIVFNRIGSPQ
jgi:hypothetical protein